ncbi:MAG: ABC transporter substrate-binding protein [Chloroflexota bacterium]
MAQYCNIAAVTRRSFLRVGTLTSVGLAAACAPAAAPASPAVSPSRPAPQKAAWENEWDKVVEAGKKEGKVVIQTPAGAGYRPAIDAFAKAYPAIEPEQQAFPDSNAFIPKITGERQAGIYNFDVAATTVTPMIQIFKPQGIIDPLKPVLILPEVVDDNAWSGGFESRFADLTKTHIFYHQLNITKSIFVNTELAKEDDIKTVDDLLDPRWKGKIVASDVTQGYVYTPAVLIREQKGEDWLRRFFIDQEPQIIRDRRLAAEALVRGRAPIGFGIHPIVLRDIQTQLKVDHVKVLDVLAFGGGDIVSLFNKAPHPNAAKVFINWLLSKAGQTAWSTNTRVNSARADVPVVDKDNTPGKRKYENPTSEEWAPKTKATQEFLMKLMQR